MQYIHLHSNVAALRFNSALESEPKFSQRTRRNSICHLYHCNPKMESHVVTNIVSHALITITIISKSVEVQLLKLKTGWMVVHIWSILGCARKSRNCSLCEWKSLYFVNFEYAWIFFLLFKTCGIQYYNFLIL